MDVITNVYFDTKVKRMYCVILFTDIPSPTSARNKSDMCK